MKKTAKSVEKVAHVEPEFPPYTCGVCSFYETLPETKEEGRCYGFPPYLGVQMEQLMWLRGATVEPNEPACTFFKPRMHA